MNTLQLYCFIYALNISLYLENITSFDKRTRFYTLHMYMSVFDLQISTYDVHFCDFCTSVKMEHENAAHL
jgi:hypothetical protein